MIPTIANSNLFLDRRDDDRSDEVDSPLKQTICFVFLFEKTHQPSIGHYPLLRIGLEMRWFPPSPLSGFLNISQPI